MNDTELFELCKQVYEATGWETPQTQWSLGTGAMGSDEMCPLYTSDYLLEKLESIMMPNPDVQDEPHIVVEHSGVVKRHIRWVAKAYIEGWFEEVSDTPLKALLKLTIALHEAGVEI